MQHEEWLVHHLLRVGQRRLAHACWRTGCVVPAAFQYGERRRSLAIAALLPQHVLLRHGLGAENMAWSFMFLFLPLTCVYYPVEVLPSWLQASANQNQKSLTGSM